MKNLIKKEITGLFLSAALLSFITQVSAQKRTFYVYQEEISRTVEQIQKERGFNNADFYLRFEVLDKPSGNPINGLEVRLFDINYRNIEHSYFYYGERTVNPYIDTTDSDGKAVFPIQKDDLNNKLNNVKLRIRGNLDYYKKELKFDLNKLIYEFKADPTSTKLDSSLSRQGFEFIRYNSYERYLTSLTKDEQSKIDDGFKKIKTFEYSSGQDNYNWGKTVWVIPLRIEMERIPKRTNPGRER